jgi:hypothetical protein
MNSYHFITLQRMTTDDPLELTQLKSQFNRLANQINLQWPSLS